MVIYKMHKKHTVFRKEEEITNIYGSILWLNFIKTVKIILNNLHIGF